MPAADPVPAADDWPGPDNRAVWRRPAIIAVAVGVVVACLVTALIVLAGRPGTPSRSRASAAPATPSATVRWINDSYGGDLAVAGGTVYVSDNGVGTVAALDAATGRLRWNSAIGDPPGYSYGPAVAGGTVYVSDNGGTVYALDVATGRPRWTYTTGNFLDSTPAVAGGTVYVSYGGPVYALDAGS